MNQNKKRINIMTSCDENYAKLIPIQLLSIADNIGDLYEIHFYFFYHRVNSETVDSLLRYSDSLGINFHDIYISDSKPYAELSEKGGGWAYEAYFTLECHKYLPPEVDRILYIDSADVLILGDIGEYYFYDFENCSLIATAASFKMVNDELQLFENGDITSHEYREQILRGLFNSGSFVINVDKMRRGGLSLNNYIMIKNSLEKLYPDSEMLYYGDQGLLSIAFIGDIKFFGWNEEKNIWYQPYNFCIWFFERSAEVCSVNPWYAPRILHFAGCIKPWEFTNEDEKNLKPGQWSFYKIYMLYNSICNTKFK